jgi:hypothetical protein
MRLFPKKKMKDQAPGLDSEPGQDSNMTRLSSFPEEEEENLSKKRLGSFSIGNTANSTPAMVGEEAERFTPVGFVRSNLKSEAAAKLDFNQRVEKLGVNPVILDAAMGGLTSPQRVSNAAPKVLTASQKLISAIKNASKPRADLEDVYTAERSVRAARGAKALEEGGQEGYFKALGSLKGELATTKPKFEPFTLEQSDVDDLFNQVGRSPKLDFYEKITANDGLQKLFSGKIPQQSQLSLLEDIFGSDLIKAVQSKRSVSQKLGSIVLDTINIPRSLITSIDMSAPLRQGVLLTVTKPKQSIPAAKEMFVDFFSEKNFNQWLDDIPNNPMYQRMKDSKLYIANPNKISGGLGAREESFMSNLAERIPVVGSLVKASSRAYIGYLNKLRVDVFTNMAQKFEQEGIADPENLKSLANFVNSATGRGDLGNLNRVAAQLNATFFSPRLIASRVNFLNPVWYAKQTPAVRKEAIKTFAEFVGIGSTVLTLAKLGGADVETDPRSSDFGKIRVGDTRWDIWGGFQQWVRVFSQLASGERKTAKGDIMELSEKKFPFDSRFDVALNFGLGKLAPVPGLAVELMKGQKLFGDDLTLTGEIAENSIPLYLQDMDDAIKDLGPEALFTVGVPAFFGVGTQSYSQKRGSRLSTF